MCHKCRKTKASKSTLYVRYKRLLNPRVTVRPPQTCCWQVSLKNESAARPGEVLSQLKQYHKQPLFFRCYWAQVVFHWITSSNTDYITFFQINKQDFKQRHKTKTWICNSANQALLNKKKKIFGGNTMKGSPCLRCPNPVDAGEGCSTQSSRADGNTAQALLLSLDTATFTLTHSKAVTCVIVFW